MTKPGGKIVQTTAQKAVSSTASGLGLQPGEATSLQISKFVLTLAGISGCSWGRRSGIDREESCFLDVDADAASTCNSNS